MSALAFANGNCSVLGLLARAASAIYADSSVKLYNLHHNT